MLGDIGIQKKVSDATIALIREHLSEIGIALPLKSEEDVQTITDYFEEIGISLSNALSDGGRVDRSQLDAAARAFDELTDFEEDDIRDLEDLNKRLGPA